MRNLVLNWKEIEFISVLMWKKDVRKICNERIGLAGYGTDRFAQVNEPSDKDSTFPPLSTGWPKQANTPCLPSFETGRTQS